MKMQDDMKRICANCGCTYGSHLGTAYYSNHYKDSFPKDFCPGHEGRMDWDNNKDRTTFKLKESENESE